MKIADRFWTFINENSMFQSSDRILLGVSGGRDSMLMLWLFRTQHIPLEVAHCNFQLRGDESDADEIFVETYCAEHQIPYHVRHFDTERFAMEHKISIQMAARQLRYSWFEELANERNCTAIAIAQHKHDQVETVLLNLARGTGLSGLQGILPKRARIIRPMLFLDAREVNETVQRYKIPYRDDSSNFSNKYARNKIRLDITPQFEQIYPNFIDSMIDNIERFRDGYQVLQRLIDKERQELFRNDGAERWVIDRATIRHTDSAMLYYLFEPYGYTKPTIRDLQEAVDRDPGRIFESASHQILLDRKHVILQALNTQDYASTSISEGETRVDWGQYYFGLGLDRSKEILQDKNIAKLDYALLQFPLLIRSWQRGDYFHPLGMRGRKKLSDFFVQQKVNLFDKKSIPILVNGNGEIVWVAGLRIDDRYKITENTQKVLTLVCQKKGT